MYLRRVVAKKNEDAQKMHRAKILAIFFFLENGKSVTLEVMICLD